MRALRAAAAAAICAVGLWGCGGMGGSLPTGPGNTCTENCTVAPPLQSADGGTPVTPQAETSLWPLSTGSSWSYRITDPLRGVFEKNVSVLGPQEIPETGGGQGIAV